MFKPAAPIAEDSGSEDDGSQYYLTASGADPRNSQTYEVVVKTNNVGSLRMLVDSFYRFNKLHGSLLIKALSPSTGRVTIDDIQRASGTESRTVFCLRTGPFSPHTSQRAEELGVTISSFSVFHELLDAVFEPFFTESSHFAEELSPRENQAAVE